MLEPGTVLLFLLAVATVIYSTWRSSPKEGLPPAIENSVSEVKPIHALLFVIAGSAVLLLIFYFLTTIEVVLTIMFSLAAVSALVFVLQPFAESWLPRNWPADTRVPYLGPVPTATVVLFPIAVIITAAYLFSRSQMSWNWILNDLVGFALCVQFVALLRVNSLLVATVLLIAVFFYDIFWVFFSRPIFGDNVMVHAAQIELPIKLLCPVPGSFTMLGLGDIVLPSLLIAFNMRMDQDRRRAWYSGYWFASLVGYTVGLVACYLALAITAHAQPATIYLNPGILIPTLILAWKRGELSELWKGKKPQLYNSDEVEALVGD
uniref:Uncharacterized protein n=1 Tax=Cyanoptyche gloeocystis TaxID=77922 RepID=A0A7S2NNJ0_9EUKA|mmetsp:Transcript_2150/g.4016  ORF Transcript_2150/g.4016 Transcript_2150/m.4016 type:complete len:320 (+) Transcript_2150:36-995(+)